MTPPAIRMLWFSKEELKQRVDIIVHDILELFAQISLHKSDHQECTEFAHDDVTAVSGFEGDFNGYVLFQCSEALAMKIASRMLQTPLESVDENVRDALGEVVNIICGDVKLFLSTGGRKVQLLTPSVFLGEELACTDLLGMGGPETLIASYCCENEPLRVGVLVRRGR